MARPSKYPEWASDTVAETTEVGSVNNKSEPTEAFKDSGLLYKQPCPYPFLNYQFNLVDEWTRNFDERAYGVIGDVYISTVDYSASMSTLNTKFGGTWTARGSQALGSIVTAYVYERTA